MRAAIYVRRSTDEHQAASLAVQEEEALRFATSQGWTVDPGHIYREDAVSRAEFKKRPALIGMLNAADRDAFDVVITRDETRLGGDMIRTGLLVQDLLDKDIQLHYYFSGERVRLDDATSKFLLAARNFASELEREKISQRTREHLLTKARRGLNVGGRVYGYNNIERKDGERRIHVEYEINDREAEVVRSIFTMYACQGLGLKRITKTLNARRIPSPHAGRRGTGSWSPSVIHDMLRRERYRGVIEWGRMAKTYRGGTKVRVRRAGVDVRVERPDLRIIDDELWMATQARIAGSSTVPRSKGGRRPSYLLSGISRCGECGGPIVATNGKQGKEPCKVYVCGWHRSRGDEVCAMRLRRPVSEVNAEVVRWVRRRILHERFVVEAVRELRAGLLKQTREAAKGVRALETEATKLRREVDRLVNALATTDEKPDAVVQALAERQARVRDLEAQIRVARMAPEAVSAEAKRLEAEARRRIAELQTVFDANPEEARAFLVALFPEKLSWRPIETAGCRFFELTAEAVVGPAIIGPSGFHKGASPAGVEPALAT
jgi:site-specific DNA recombinase